MLARDRVIGFTLLLLAVAAWAAVGWLLLNRSPIGQPVIQLTGAVAIGTAVGITVWPLLWLLGYARQRTIAYRGDWSRAGRRALIVGLTVGVLVMLRGAATLSLPLAAFVITLAVLVEAAFSLKR
jgi:hypothetical protein